MSNHFTAIGLPFRDRDAYSAGLERLYEAARHRHPAPDGSGLLWEWRDPSGAAFDLLFEGDDDDLSFVCGAPRFTSDLRCTVAVTSLVDDECPGCVTARIELRDDDGSMVYPMIAAPARIGVERTSLDVSGASRGASIGLIAEEVAVFADADAFAADETMGSFAPESFVPMGMFGEPSPRVLCNGTVIAVERRRVDLFDSEFAVLRVQSLGARYDIACGVDEADGVRPGGIVAVTAWATAEFH